MDEFTNMRKEASLCSVLLWLVWYVLVCHFRHSLPSLVKILRKGMGWENAWHFFYKNCCSSGPVDGQFWTGGNFKTWCVCACALCFSLHASKQNKLIVNPCSSNTRSPVNACYWVLCSATTVFQPVYVVLHFPTYSCLADRFILPIKCRNWAKCGEELENLPKN